MKTDYPTKKLGEVCEIEYGTRVVKSRNKSGQYYVYGGGGKTFTTTDHNRENRVIISRFGMSAHCVRRVTGKFFLNDSGLTLSPKNILELSPEYLDSFLFSIEEEIFNLGRGQAQRNLSMDEFKQLEIHLPSLVEQKKIAAKLERVLAKISEAKKLRAEARENADNLLPAELHKIFSQQHTNKLENVGISSIGKNGWEEKELGEVCEKTSNIKWDEHENESFQYIDLTSVSREGFSITETKEVNSKNAPSRAKKVINTNDVIFGTTRPTLMCVTIIPPEYNNHVCSTGFAVLRARKEDVLPQFIYYFIRSERFMDRMENIQTGASYPAVSDAKVLETKISLPPLAEQKKIVARLDSFSEKIGKIKNLHSATQNDFAALEQSILSKSFNG